MPGGRVSARAALVLAGSLLLVAALLAPTSGSGQQGGPPTPQPVLGAADREMKLMGAAPEGAPGEAWGYRRLPVEVGSAVADGTLVQFASPPKLHSPDPQLAFMRYTHASGWQVAETPLDEQGRPYRGPVPNQSSARITRGGGGLLVGRDPNRVPPDFSLEDQVTVLIRHPGGRFFVLGRPPPDVLAPASGSQPAEALADGDGAGAVATTAFERDGRTAAFFAVKGRAVERAVAYFDGERWTRELVEAPAAATTRFEILALAATGPDNAWLLARTQASLGRGIVLFERVDDGSPRWVERDLGAPHFAAAATPSVGVEQVEALSGPAQALTVTEDGVWMDGRLHAASGEVTSTREFTLFFDRAQRRVTGSWCDALAPDGSRLCAQPLGARLDGAGGYRSFAWAGDGFGERIVTNALDVGGTTATNRGSYLRLEGAGFLRLPGGGGNFRESGAFSSPDEGWLEGPVHITREPQPSRAGVAWPLSLRAPLTAVAAEPGKPLAELGSGALAVGMEGGVARYVPGSGWVREFLLTSAGAVSKPNLRGVAWPEPARAHAVGDLGTMWTWRVETGLWEKDQAAPIGFEGNLMDVAFDPWDAERGYAVGRSGALLRYGKTWAQEQLPAGFGGRDLTQVAFAGRQAIVAAGADLLLNDGGGWRVDAGAAALLDSVPGGNARLLAVAGLPDGGAVAAGEHVVIERDGPGSPWRFSDQPLPGSTVIAAGAYRDGARVRAVASVVPQLRYPPPDNLPPPDPNVPPPILQAFPLPGDGYLLRETAAGWRDEQHTSFAGSGPDRPFKSDPVLDLLLDAGGAGWVVGGWSGEQDSAGRGSSGRNQTGKLDRQRVQTAAVLRYGTGAAPPPASTLAAVPTPPGPARFVVASHGQCEQPCSLLAGQGIGPDRGLEGALAKAGALAAQPAGARFLLYGGGRVGATEAQSPDEARRYAQVLGAQPGLPVFGAVSGGDSAGGDAGAFRSAFEPFNAPFGRGAAPPGVDAGSVPGVPPAAGARTHYAFDSHGPGGVLRVIVIDNSAGSLAASDPHQNPPEAQLPWLRAVLADAHARGIATIVLGSRDLNARFTPRVNAASDGDEVGRALVQGGASAYFFERPEENRAYRIPSGGSDTIPAFGSGTLAYRSATSNVAGFRGRVGGSANEQPDALFGEAGLLLAEVDLASRDPRTNRAPVGVRLIPLMEELSLLPLDGVLLRRSRAVLFQGVGRRPRSGDRWGRVSSADGNANPPGGDPYVSFPPRQCLVAGCSTRLDPEYEFVSSDPDIGDFVRQDPSSANLRKPLLGPNDKVVSDSRSGLFCPFNAGVTTLTVRAGGLAYSQAVRVLPGSVQRPCGTRPLRPDRFRRAAASAAPPAPPPPAPQGNQPVSFTPPAPPPAAPAPPAPPPPPSPPATTAFLPPAEAPAFLPLVALATPPPAVRPTPPSGGMGRAYQVEERREEEAAPEESQAFARYEPHDGSVPPTFLLGMLALAAFAGATIAGGARSRRERPRPALAALDEFDTRTTRQRRQLR